MSKLSRVSLDGTLLVVESEGRGRPLVLLHGFAEDRRTWDEISGVLSTEHRIVRYDLRGYGESLESGNTGFRHANDLLQVLDALQIPHCDLMGVSLGASIALNFSLDFPDRVRHLILISPGLIGWEWSDEWRSRWSQIRDAARNGPMVDARELWWNHPLFETARGSPGAQRRLRTSLERYSGKHWIHDNEDPALPDLDRLPTLSVPTLLLSGTRDIAEFRLIADLIAAAAPTVTRREIDGGHLLQLERPAEVIDLVRGFLA